MKKFYPYLIGGFVLLFLVVLIASRSRPTHRFDERITLRQGDKIPYGTAVAKHLLPSLFPAASVQFDNRYPGSWEGVDAYNPDQAVILVSDYFGAGKEEMDRLNEFVAKGNSVFIIARRFSDDAANYFGVGFTGYNDLFSRSDADSLRVKLERPAFGVDSFFAYPGKQHDGAIRWYDTARTQVLGKNSAGRVNFIRLKKGDGSFFVHTAPLAFSNYFILHKHNIAYYQNALSVIPQNTKAVLWNEYFLDNRANEQNKDVPWLAALFKNPAFRWGFLVAIVTLAISMLLGMRRRQRMIPPHEKPKNDSLDFVKTLGRLYYDNRNHKNLAEKMGAYFLEHVRSVYKIPTHTLDEDFVKLLHAKSGHPQAELTAIVQEITQFQQWPNLSEEKLANFHKSLEYFYQNT